MEIKALTAVDIPHIPAVISGYQTNEIYQVTLAESANETVFALRLTTLPQPLHKRFPPLEQDDLERYRLVPAQGFSYGLFNQEILVGVALAEEMHWNNSLWVWEFHISSGYRGQGWGRLLMSKLIAQAQTNGLRTIVCETQNTNVPAIRFYQRMGFRLEGVDTSYYSNEDMQPEREVALFMKRRINRSA